MLKSLFPSKLVISHSKLDRFWCSWSHFKAHGYGYLYPYPTRGYPYPQPAGVFIPPAIPYAPFLSHLEEAGIQHQLTVVHVHQQGGEIERLMRTLQGCMLAMLTWACLPLTYWGEAALMALYLYNLTLQSLLPPNITPYKMYNNKKPDISHLQVFRAYAFAHVPLKLQTKLC